VELRLTCFFADVSIHIGLSWCGFRCVVYSCGFGFNLILTMVNVSFADFDSKCLHRR